MIRKLHPTRAALLVFAACLALPLFAQQNKARKPAPTAAATANWANWRGPSFNGMAATDAPTQWSDTQNIRWKAAIPGRGHSTPVIWGDKIFLTTAVPTDPTALTKAAPPPPPRRPDGPPPGDRPPGGPPPGDRPPGGPPPGGGRPGGGGGRPGGGGVGAGVEHKFIVLALDRKTGKLLWQQSPKTATPHEGYHAMYGSFASNSPVTDGKYLWAFFGSRGAYCYDLNGKLIWEKDFGVQMKMRLQFGEGGAPALVGDKLVLLFDHDGGSFLVALDKATGKELWRTTRDEISTWTSPFAFEHAGRAQIVVSATRKVRGYDLATGKQLWECGGLGVNVIPQPVYQDGVVYAMSGYVNPKLLAIRLGKEGDLTGSEEILWTQTRGLSYTASPLLHDSKLYTLTDNGMLSAFNAKTGEPYYQQQRLPKPYNFKASPVGANGKLYLASEDGDVIVIKLGEKYEVLATNTLADQMFIASPVIVDGELFLRSQNQLFCISERPGK